MRTASMPAAKAKGQRIRAALCFLCEPFKETKLARLVEFIHAACHMRLDRFSRIGHFGQQRTHFFNVPRPIAPIGRLHFYDFGHA